MRKLKILLSVLIFSCEFAEGRIMKPRIRPSRILSFAKGASKTVTADPFLFVGELIADALNVSPNKNGDSTSVTTFGDLNRNPNDEESLTTVIKDTPSILWISSAAMWDSIRIALQGLQHYREHVEWNVNREKLPNELVRELHLLYQNVTSVVKAREIRLLSDISLTKLSYSDEVLQQSILSALVSAASEEILVFLARYRQEKSIMLRRYGYMYSSSAPKSHLISADKQGIYIAEGSFREEESAKQSIRQDSSPNNAKWNSGVFMTEEGSAEEGNVAILVAEVGSAEMGIAEYEIAEMRFADYGSAQIGFADYGNAQIGFADYGSAEIGFADYGSAEIEFADYGSAEIGFAGYGSVEIGFADFGSAEALRAEEENSEIGSAEAFFESATRESSAAIDEHSRNTRGAKAKRRNKVKVVSTRKYSTSNSKLQPTNKMQTVTESTIKHSKILQNNNLERQKVKATTMSTQKYSTSTSKPNMRSKTITDTAGRNTVSQVNNLKEINNFVTDHGHDEALPITKTGVLENHELNADKENMTKSNKKEKMTSSRTVSEDTDVNGKVLPKGIAKMAGSLAKIVINEKESNVKVGKDNTGEGIRLNKIVSDGKDVITNATVGIKTFAGNLSEKAISAAKWRAEELAGVLGGSSLLAGTGLFSFIKFGLPVLRNLRSLTPATVDLPLQGLPSVIPTREVILPSGLLRMNGSRLVAMFSMLFGILISIFMRYGSASRSS